MFESHPASGTTMPLQAQILRANPYMLAALVFCLGLLAAPLVYFHYDMVGCWLPWSRATQGTAPWDIYQTDCNYPPFVPYLLTLSEKARLLLGASEAGPVSVTLIKAPYLIAFAAGVPLCWWGLRKPFGAASARAAAVLYALCLPLFINAAIWGQTDALLSLALIAALVALLNEKLTWAGAAMGWALSIKLQAIVLVPALIVFVARKYGAKALLRPLAVGLFLLALIALPHVLGGSAKPMLASYTHATDFFPRRTLGAYNGWYLLDGFDTKIRRLPEQFARADNRSVLGPVTFKHIGLILFGTYLLFLLAGLWRRPDPSTLILACAMSVFAFFMLPTQMHDRYIVPAAALLVLGAVQSRPALVLFLGVSATASLNQLNALLRHNLTTLNTMTPVIDTATLGVGGIVALANIVLLAWATRRYWRQVAGQESAPAAVVLTQRRRLAPLMGSGMKD